MDKTSARRGLLASLLAFALFIPSAAAAQPAPNATNTTDTTAQPQKQPAQVPGIDGGKDAPKSTPNDDAVLDLWKEILLGIFATTSAILTSLLSRASKLLSLLTNRTLPPAKFIETRATQLLMVGPGNTGKTTFLRTLSGCHEINPQAATADVKKYVITRETQNDEIQVIHRVTVADYRGQNWAKHVIGILADDDEPTLYTNVLIILDLFPEFGIVTNPIDIQAFDGDHVTAHVRAFTGDILKIITAAAGPGCRHICLFINKVDLLPNVDKETTLAIVQTFSPLITELSKVAGANGQQLQVIIGSMKKGVGLYSRTAGDISVAPGIFDNTTLYDALYSTGARSVAPRPRWHLF